MVVIGDMNKAISQILNREIQIEDVKGNSVL
jgi:hypothetical protein